jgi:hypothetical protein
MSVQRAKAEFQLVSMERSDLDGYVSRFERLARLASYDLNSSLVLDRFGSKLIPGLYAAIINGPDEPVTWVLTTTLLSFETAILSSVHSLPTPTWHTSWQLAVWPATSSFLAVVATSSPPWV